jgi:predicted exporter/SAM-dependent methyltransferase
MFLRRYPIRWPIVAVVVIVVAALFFISTRRLSLDFDLTASLPRTDPVLSDARYVVQNHPVQDRLVIDVAHKSEDINLLVDGGALVEKRLRESGLFKRVGLEDQYVMVPELMEYVAHHLPILFTAKELEEKVKPLLTPRHIHDTIQTHFLQLSGLDSVGQARFVAQDPLALRNIILSRLAHLAPSRQIEMYRGQILSPDKRHLLIVAEPNTPATDTAYGRKVVGLIESITSELARDYGQRDTFTLTPVGAYRAALDNELSAKRDTRQAVIFSTVAIAILLLLGFPRPFIGLLALLPAFAGTILALFIYSLFKQSISMLAVGFGGAIISFTVDYGIAYLLFLDRPYATHGLEATKEVWSLGLLAMLTTAVSFSFLFMGGFDALSQLGWFAALGVLFTFVFVHLIYPFIFPSVPPARRDGFLPLQRLVNVISTSERTWKAWAALIFCLVMLFFAKPDIRIDLGSMNSISADTAAAEKLVKEVWGGVANRVFLVLEADNIAELQKRADRLAVELDQEEARGILSSSFAPSLLFPGEERAARNMKDWRAFWSPDRVAALNTEIDRVGRQAGFAPGAFAPFFKLIGKADYTANTIPDRYFDLLGISQKHNGRGISFFTTLIPGPAYRPEAFYSRLTASSAVRIFDPSFFGEKLGSYIFSGFLKVALIVGIVTVIVALLYLLDLPLTLVAMAPTVFALICTVGTLNLLGEPLGIPMIMVSVVIIGMGTDYALYLVRSYQRYMDDYHPSLGLIRLSVFMSFATTFLGFGVLALSGHVLLRSVGIGLALGIGYSYLGSIAIVPPLVRWILKQKDSPPETNLVPGSVTHRSRVLARYRHMEAFPRLYARFKMRSDPLFARLADLVKTPRMILDIGCGYGLYSAWLLELYPAARVHAVEPDRKRALFAQRVIGRQGVAIAGKVADLQGLPEQADAALLLDALHYLSDDDLRLTVGKIHASLVSGGVLITRVPNPHGPDSCSWNGMKVLMDKMLGPAPVFHSPEEIAAMVSAAGFQVVDRDREASEEGAVVLTAVKT